MNPDSLYLAHVTRLQSAYEETLHLLEESHVHIDAVVLHSGSSSTYFADDAEFPFRPHPHFTHWLPVHRPNQFLLIMPGRKPTYFRVQPTTYWSDSAIRLSAPQRKAFRVIDVDSPEQIVDRLPRQRHIAFIGANTDLASRLGLPSTLHNLNHLRNRLDYQRSLKSEYEVELIREANRVALKGHQAGADAFFGGAGEREIHAAYLKACGALEHEMPFETIVALDDRAALLHYQHKRNGPGNKARLLLLDAGYRLKGYASDITRTHARPSAHPVLHELIARITRLKDDVIRDLKPGISFQDLNQRAHSEITSILLDLDLARGTADALREKNVSSLFFPHGLGHLLGIQVHDVGGLFKDETGTLEPPPDEHKALRLTRVVEKNMVMTVEPGFYFIPMLLNSQEHAEKTACLNRPLIDELIPFGGVRIEDNVVIRSDGAENLTPKEPS